MKIVRYKALIAMCIMAGSLRSMVGADIALLRESRMPISMDRGGIGAYFSGLFQKKGYGNFCLRHASDFCAYSNCTEEPRAYLDRVFAIFELRIKEAQWINPYEFSEFLQNLVTHVAPHMRRSRTNVLMAVEKKIYDALVTKFSDFKRDPEGIIRNLTEDVVDTVDHLNDRTLHDRVNRMLLEATSKLIWSPRDGIGMWEVTKQIASQLETLAVMGVVPDTVALDSSLWTLTYRWLYMLDLCGDDLPSAWYEAVLSDMGKDASVLWRVREGEVSVMRTREQWLHDGLQAGMMRAKMTQQGFVMKDAI